MEEELFMKVVAKSESNPKSNPVESEFARVLQLFLFQNLSALDAAEQLNTLLQKGVVQDNTYQLWELVLDIAVFLPTTHEKIANLLQALEKLEDFEYTNKGQKETFQWKVLPKFGNQWRDAYDCEF